MNAAEITEKALEARTPGELEALLGELRKLEMSAEKVTAYLQFATITLIKIMLS
jgi:hypothetical protein